MTVLLIILAIIFIILVLPFGVSVSLYDAVLAVDAHVAVFNFRIYPAVESEKSLRRKAKRELKKRERDAAKEVAGEPATAEEKAGFVKSLFAGVDRDFIMDAINVALSAVGRFRRKLVVNVLILHLIIAHEDPYTTALLYGGIDAALANLVQLLESSLNIKYRDIRTWASFETTRMQVEFELRMTLNLAKLFAVGFMVGFSMLRALLRARKRTKAALAAEERTVNDGSSAKAEQNV